MFDDKSIIALASPPGSGAISLIRISGSDAIVLGDTCFKSIKNKMN